MRKRRRQRLVELWNRVEAELRAALAIVGQDLSPQTVSTVEEFLDHNELGLAFDFLVEALLEREPIWAAAAYDHLERAATDMELADSDIWSRFASRFVKPS